MIMNFVFDSLEFSFMLNNWIVLGIFLIENDIFFVFFVYYKIYLSI